MFQILRLLTCVLVFFIQACGEGMPSVSDEDELEPPQDVRVTPGSTANQIFWIMEEGVTYLLKWTVESSLPLEDWQEKDNVTSPYLHENLENNTTYYYRIIAEKDGKKSKPSTQKKGMPSASKLLPPTGVEVEAGDRKLQISWTAVPGVSLYKIYWTDQEGVDPRLANDRSRDTKQTTLNLEELINGTTYYFVIVSTNDEAESEPTEVFNGTPQLSRPEAPTNVRTGDETNDSVMILWDAVPGADSYYVYWSKSGPTFDVENANFDIVDGSKTFFNLSPLNDRETQWVKVAAANEFGIGPPSIPLEVTLELPIVVDPNLPRPTDIKVTVDGLTAEVEWKSASTEFHYQFFYATEPGVAPDNYLTLENGGVSDELRVPQGDLNRLKVAKRYYLVVVAFGNGKQSPPSEEYTFMVPIPLSQFNRADLETGARLYARWYEPINTPNVFNPLLQEAAKDKFGKLITQFKEADSWRCAECHGWDYKGKDGEYGYGSQYFTGFPGVADAAINMTPEEIYNFMMSGITSSGGDHQFEEHGLKHDDAVAIIKFIMEASNVSDFWAGNENKGQQIFTTDLQGKQACNNSGCHTRFTDITDLDVLPQALGNTARAVHVIRYGMNRMPGGRSLQDARDVLRYLWMQQPNLVPDNFDEAVYDQTGQALYDQIAQGGVLYDRWWLARSETLAELPISNHPLWPQTITSLNGSYTWRCQTCHGWDYQGNLGANKAGPYFTNIAGILESTGLSDTPADLYQFLRTNDMHAYSNFLSDSDIYALTRFVFTLREEALHDLAPHQLLDSRKGEPLTASADAGSVQYNDTIESGGCESCHQKNSTDWYFQDIAPERNEIQTVASIAKENPQEFLHKVRFGQPGSTMEGLFKLGMLEPTSALDILAFAQTLLDPDLRRGARLYDNWWEENRLAEPIGQHSLWPAAGSEIPQADTWRCVSCHGWDYQGAEGFGGLINLVNEPQSFITSGTVINPDDHAFANYLKQQDVSDLLSFITDPANNGVRADIMDLIQASNGNNGQVIYHGTTPGNCVNCHGTSGTNIPTVDLNTVAASFAQRFVHVARFGSPGSIMLPGLSRYTGLTAEEAVDVQNYAVNFNSPFTSNVSIDRGGRLFDNWFVEMKASDPNVEDPAIVNPLWEARNPAIPDVQSLSDSWRCVSCHDWNYKGRDVLADSPDADNLLNRIEQRRLIDGSDEGLVQYLVTWITNGIGGVHNYGTPQSGLPTVLGEREINDIAAFLLQGILDSSLYIRNLDGGSAISPDIVRGKAFYEGNIFTDINCASCHGATGDALPPGESVASDIFALAKNNPWQFFHKTRFAAPGTDMPALNGIPGLNVKEAVNILGYAQSEFDKRPQ